MSYMNGISMLDAMLNEHDMPCASFDLGKDESGMTLQRYERGEWVDVIEDGQAPADIDELPSGKYRLVE